MSTPFDTFGNVGRSTGQKLVAALILPSGLTTAAGTTITGGQLNGTVTVPTGATKVYLSLSESSVSSVYEGQSLIAGTLLPDTTNRPYMVESRIVASGTDMTSYSAIAAAFEASTTPAGLRSVPDYGGYLVSGVWYIDQAVATAATQSTQANTKATAIQDKTDNLPALPAAKSDVQFNLTLLSNNGSVT